MSKMQRLNVIRYVDDEKKKRKLIEQGYSEDKENQSGATKPARGNAKNGDTK